MTNKLVRKLEVRFKRSGQKYKPLQSTADSDPGKLTSIDSLDFRDANDRPFYEPTTELSRVKELINGWFSVVLVPTTEHDVHRWHIFSYDKKEEKVVITSIRSSSEGLFDVKDHFVVHPKPEAISGIEKRTINLHAGNDSESLKVINGIAAASYYIQMEHETTDGPQLMRGAKKIMLAIPTSDGNTATLSFSVAVDGTLSRVNKKSTGKGHPLRATEHEIMLLLNTLDKVAAFGNMNHLANGLVHSLKRNTHDDNLVISTFQDLKKLSEDPTKLKIGDFIEIEGTHSIDGHYDKVSDIIEKNPIPSKRRMI